ncbi:winged helix-turn-helix domain-containing protein, partial [Devosia insulae]|uniref:winged helix-turn-helix domain-containing protein n=1 Tax=Devosia insulae TaxID=408174 RepID=UPI00114CD2B7
MSDQRIICGPFAIDVPARLATRNGEPLPVGHRGVALLATLFRRPGEVLTKSELIDAAWSGAAVEESNLTVQVAALRKALGPSPTGGEWIVTIPRVGYRFVSPAAPSPPPSEQPSIAVLPFVNLSSDAE